MLGEIVDPIVRDIRERVSQLKMYDMASEIHSYCDNLEGEVMLNIESAIKHLKRIEADFLAEIRSYREELINSLPESGQSASNASCLSKMTQRAMKTLEEKVDRFELGNRDSLKDNGCNSHLKLDSELSLKIKQLGNDLSNTARELTAKARRETFKENYLTFKLNQIFLIDKNHIGRLQHVGDINEPKRRFLIDKLQYEFTEEKIHFTNANFLDNNKLICCISGGGFLIKDGQNTKTMGEKIEKFNDISACATLPNGMFLVGTKNGYGSICVLEDEETYGGQYHQSDVIDIQNCKDGRVATMSFDNTIRIWAELFSPLSVITGHGCTRYRCQFGVLSNGYLVTCSNDTDQCVLRIWNHHTGRLVQEKPAGMKAVCALSVLSNDDIVLASRDGSVKVMSPCADEGIDKVFIKAKENNWTNFILVLPNDDIIIADSLTKPQLQVWDPHKGELIQSVETGHTGEITKCCMCPSKKKLVTSSQDGLVKVWQMNSGAYFEQFF